MSHAMTVPLPFLRLTDATILREGGIETSDLVIRSGRIGDRHDAGTGATLSLSGYYLLPGIIDLCGEAVDKHLSPRPDAPVALGAGLAATDRDAASNGVTTAWMAQGWSWEGGRRGPDFAQAFLAAHQALKPQLATDLRIRICCQTHTMDSEAALIDAIMRYAVDYVVFHNHIDKALLHARANRGVLEGWAQQAGRQAHEHMALLEKTALRGGEVPRYLCNLATAFDNLGVKYGSHDDPDAQTRERYAMIGAKICERPSAVSAASVAKTWGDPVLMSAPDVMRSAGTGGTISAMSLVRQGLCSALISDYHYPSLAQAAFRIVDEGVLPLERAWALISKNPARIMRLDDRGRLAPGLRADLAIVNKLTRQIEGTLTAGAWSHLSGALAHLLTTGDVTVNLAAE